jgi:hypothetical protein
VAAPAAAAAGFAFLDFLLLRKFLTLAFKRVSVFGARRKRY